MLMGGLMRIWRQVLGLVVDDGSLAVAALFWIAIVWAAMAYWGVLSGWAGLILFAGQAAILVENVARRARR